MDPTTEKAILRQQLRAQRSQLSSDFCQSASRQIIQHLISVPGVRQARHVALYWPSFNECNPLLLIKELRHAHIYLPVITPNQILDFYPYQEGEALINNQFNIPEPSTQNKEPIAATKLDLIVMPLLAFDGKARRLGMGGGYYDRSLAFITNSALPHPLLIGLAYEFQKLDQVPTDSWDIPLDCVATELRLYRRSTT